MSPVRHAGGIVTDASWFATEVLRRLSGVKRGGEPGQFYARCPAHEDKRASLAIKAGSAVTIVYWCHAVPGCDQAAIRDALAGLGVPEEHLGQYGTPEYERRRQVRTGDSRRELDTMRRELAEVKREMAGLKSGVRGLLVSDFSLAMLKVRVLAVVDDVDVPAGRKEYVPFAVRAGVSEPAAYKAWKVDPLGRGRECVTPDHVVLTQPSEDCQASQVPEGYQVIESRIPLSNREGENSRFDNSGSEKNGPSVSEAIKALHNGGIGGKLIA
jgi:hypothetical protein